MATKKANPKSKYDPSMCQRMVDMGKTGASQKMIWADLGISRKTAEEYKKKYPAFEEALDLALVHSQAFWEREILSNLENKGFNSRLAEIALRGQFQQDYRERVDIKQNIKQEVTVDFAGEIASLIQALKE
jgi:hypothetical protein